jgi:hypothetical protein
VPRILRGSPLGHAGTWIGAQAPGARGPFIQIGTNDDHFSATDSSHYAFWSDTARNFTAQFLFSVKPGDDLSASLTLVRGSSLAPSPLSDDSFTLRQATVSAAGGQYLHIATPEDVATEAFVTGFTQWTAKTPYSQMESASSRFVAALRRNARAFASKRWPTQVRGLVHSLIGDTRVLLEDSRPPALVSSVELAAWRSKWMRDAEVLSNTARMIKRILSLPEIRPVT